MAAHVSVINRVQSHMLHEEYIDILPEYLKYSLFDFRTGSQKLSVNRRSNLSIPRQERICTKCRKRILGDEFHFQFEYNGIENLEYQLYQDTIELDAAL